MNNIARTTVYLNELLEIKRTINEMPKKFLETPSWFKFMLTHGIQPPGQQEKNSISSLVEAIFGTSIDPEEYYIYVKQNIPPSIEINIASGGIPERLEALRELLKVALNISEKLGIKLTSPKATPTADEVLSQPNKLPELIEKFLNLCSNLSVGVNDLMTFIFGIRKLTKKYIKQVYPELADEKIFDKVAETLGLMVLFEPDIADEEKRCEYTIVGYPDYAFDLEIDTHRRARRHELHVAGVAEPKLCASLRDSEFSSRCEHCPPLSTFAEDYYGRQGYFCVKQAQTLGGTLCKINDMIWSVLRLASEKLGIPNVGKMYEKECRKELKNKGLSIPGWIRWTRALTPISEFTIKGSIVTTYRYTSRYAPSGAIYEERTEHLKFGLLEFLENVMPLIHLGFCELVMWREEYRVYDYVAYLVWRWAI